MSTGTEAGVSRRRTASRLGVTAAALMLLAGALASVGGTARANGGRIQGEVISPGSAPFTDSLAAMEKRDARTRDAIASGLLPAPAPIIAAPLGEQQVIGNGNPGRDVEFDAPHWDAPQAVPPGFQAISLQDQAAAFGSFSIPPDTMGAIGPNHFVQIINGSVAIFSRSGVRLSHVSLNSFFTVVVGGTTFPRNGAFHPRVLYDRRSARWFATAMERGALIGRDNDIILAVSRTAVPTGIWDKYVIPVGDETSSAGTRFFTDYSTLGTDTNGVYFGMRIFATTVGGSVSSSAKIAVTRRTPLLAGTPALGTVTQFSGITDMFSSPQPAHNFDQGNSITRQFFVASSAFGFGNLVYRTLVWTWPSGSSLSGLSTLATPTFAAPISAPASGSGVPINVGDGRVQMAVIRGGRLWTCRNVGVNATGGAAGANRTGVEWFELQLGVESAVVRQQGRVFDPAATGPRFYYYPSINVNGQGDAAMAFSGSRATEFVGAFTCGRLAAAPLNTMGMVAWLKPGEAAYQRLDGTSRNRWGDYSYTSVDPCDDQTIWTIQEYAESPANTWGTWVNRLLAPAPALNSRTAVIHTGQSNIGFTFNGRAFWDPGAGFPCRLRAQILGGAINGITVNSVTLLSPTSVFVRLSAAVSASAGARDILLTNPDGQQAKLVGGLRVDARPLAPERVSVTGLDSTTARLNWTDMSVTETDYLVQRRSGAGSYGNIAILAANANTFTNTGLTPGNAYFFRVLARNAAGTSDPNEVSLTMLRTPTNFRALGVVNVAAAEWVDTNTIEQGYRIERWTGDAYAWIGNTAANAPGFVNSGLIPNQRYTYRVRAFNGVHHGSYSNTSMATIMVAPNALTATVISGASVRLNWNDNATVEKNYVVERRVSPGGAWLRVLTLLENTETVQDNTLVSGTKYQFRVRAIAGDSVSGYTNIVGN